MAKANTNEITKTVKEATENMQERAKTAYAKSSELTSDLVEFNKGNFEAVVESGKILASGVQDMGRTAIEDTKTAAATATADVKKMAGIKSPTELFQLQGEIARRNFDTGVAQTSKNVEAMMKLANDVFAPISNRASVAAEKIRKAA
jgi:phasin family protein